MMAHDKKFMGSKDVAHILDFSPDDVIVLAQKGILHGVKNGRIWQFKLDDVLDYKKKIEK